MGLIQTKSRWSGGGGGASVFTALSDVPSSYASQARKRLRVNSAATALEFYSGPALHAEDYCAFDGITDDTENLNSLIGSLPTFGGYRRIICPYGKTALIAGEVNISKNDVIIDDLSMKLKDSVTGVNKLLYLSGHNITLNSPVIDGNCQNNPTLTYYGVLTEGVSDLKIKYGRIKNTTDNGIYLKGSTSPVQGFMLLENLITNTGWEGIRVDYGIGGKILCNDIISTGSHGINVQSREPYTSYAGVYDTQRVSILGNYVNRAVAPTNIKLPAVNT